MIIVYIVAAILAIMGIVILVGKGDNLIAGYNTASQEEREKFDIKRLRLILGIFLIVLAPLSVLFIGEDTASTMTFSVIVLVLCFILVALANSWAKKK